MHMCEAYLLRLHSGRLTRLLPNVHSPIKVAIDKLDFCRNVSRCFCLINEEQIRTVPNCPEASSPRDRTSLSENLSDSMSIVFSVSMYLRPQLGPYVTKIITHEFSNHRLAVKEALSRMRPSSSSSSLPHPSKDSSVCFRLCHREDIHEQRN